MPSMRKAALATLAVFVVVAIASLPVQDTRAEDTRSPVATTRPAVTQTNASIVQSVPSRKTPVARSSSAAPLDEGPGLAQTAGAFAGGLLMVVLAAFGLTITFRSLVKDMKGRKRRYRRRARRTEPDGAQA